MSFKIKEARKNTEWLYNKNAEALSFLGIPEEYKYEIIEDTEKTICQVIYNDIISHIGYLSIPDVISGTYETSDEKQCFNIIRRAIKWKIDNNDSNKVIDIIYDGKLNVVAYDHTLYFDIEKYVLDYLIENNCDNVAYEIASGQSSLFNRNNSYDLFSLYCEYLRKSKTYNSKRSLMGYNIPQLMDYLLSQRAKEVTINIKGTKYTEKVNNFSDILNKLFVTNKSDRPDNLAFFLLSHGFTLSELEKAFNGDMHRKPKISNTIDMICIDNDINTDSMYIRLMENKSADIALKECLEYKNKYIDHFIDGADGRESKKEIFEFAVKYVTSEKNE